MGKLTIVGKAERSVVADIVEITMRFLSHAGSSSAAAAKVIKDCEQFLENVKSWGIDLRNIHISDDDINQEFEDKELDVTATRELKIIIPFDMGFNNSLMDLIEKSDMDVDLNVQYSLSNKKELHDELLKEAINDSRKKAELIAETMDQKISGIDTVEQGDRYDRSEYMCCEQERAISVPYRKPQLSDQLKAPTTKETEAIEIVWIME
ncbi:SIMPL domain-containing protein [Butyrivibrio sp. MC2013]|uniref:SIMPL domain-containing protein n=1 Tax=Butyrivibrio sp. MC2013 TaxID=1280686 RepID=UPI000402AE36|nr:SIMPL domain-containing protein [Butyrivibrio sp. MC2013]